MFSLFIESAPGRLSVDCTALSVESAVYRKHTRFVLSMAIIMARRNYNDY